MKQMRTKDLKNTSNYHSIGVIAKTEKINLHSGKTKPLLSIQINFILR